MKKILVFLIASLALASCQQTEVQYFENGNKKSVFRKKGEQFHGESIWYHDNGKPSLKANYKDGTLHGKSINYYYNGEKEVEVNYENGIRQGESMKWFNNGKLKEEMFFVNDTLHGEYKVYYKDGQIQVSGAFDHGLFDGQWVWWNQIGLKVGEALYKDGSGVQKSWYINGREKAVIPYKANDMHGDAMFYNEQGDLTKVITYRYGEAIETTDSIN